MYSRGQRVGLVEAPGHHLPAVLGLLLVVALHGHPAPINLHLHLLGLVARGVQADLQLVLVLLDPDELPYTEAP